MLIVFEDPEIRTPLGVGCFEWRPRFDSTALYHLLGRTCWVNIALLKECRILIVRDL